MQQKIAPHFKRAIRTSHSAYPADARPWSGEMLGSGYFDDDISTTIQSASCQYLIKGKEYRTLASQVTAPTISCMKGEEGRETTELVTKLNTWDKDRRFVASRVLKPKKACNYLFWTVRNSNTPIL